MIVAAAPLEKQRDASKSRSHHLIFSTSHLPTFFFSQQNSGRAGLHNFIILIFEFFFEGQNSSISGGAFTQISDLLLDVNSITDANGQMKFPVQFE